MSKQNVYYRRGRYIACLLVHWIAAGLCAYGQAMTGSFHLADDCELASRPVWWRSDARRDLIRIDEEFSGVRLNR
jgi:hypothetical protein